MLGRRDVGQGRFFADQTYHFQTLRVLNDIAADGADTSEVLETIKHIRSGTGLNVMVEVVNPLGDPQLQALAHYFSRLR